MAKKLKSLVKPVTTPRPHAKLPKLSNEKVTSTNLRNKKAKAKLTTKAKKFPGPTTKGKLPKLSKKKVTSTNLRNTNKEKIWPLPAFYFQVEIGQSVFQFQKVTGLEAKTNFIKYSHGNSKQNYDYNIAGRTVYGDVTMEKGVFSKDVRLFEWWKNNLIEAKPQTVLIKLGSMASEDGKTKFSPEMSWSLSAAIPVQINFSEMDSQKKGAPAIEKLVIKFADMVVILP
jgi:phage tail-like protein